MRLDELDKVDELWFSELSQCDVRGLLDPVVCHMVWQALDTLSDSVCRVYIAGVVELRQHYVRGVDLIGELEQSVHVVCLNFWPVLEVIYVTAGDEMLGAEALAKLLYSCVIADFWRQQHTLFDDGLGLSFTILD